MQAHLWLSLVAGRLSDGEEREDARDRARQVAARMTPGQLAEAQALASAWKPITAPAPPRPAAMVDFFDLVSVATPSAVKWVIDRGADVKARNREGMAALVFAARNNGDAGVITTLLAAGAEIEARDGGGCTPLMWAAEWTTNPAVIAALLKAGASARTRDDEGKMAFDYAQDNEERKATEVNRLLQEASC